MLPNVNRLQADGQQSARHCCLAPPQPSNKHLMFPESRLLFFLAMYEWRLDWIQANAIRGDM